MSSRRRSIRLFHRFELLVSLQLDGPEACLSQKLRQSRNPTEFRDFEISLWKSDAHPDNADPTCSFHPPGRNQALEVLWSRAPRVSLTKRDGGRCRGSTRAEADPPRTSAPWNCLSRYPDSEPWAVRFHPALYGAEGRSIPDVRQLERRGHGRTAREPTEPASRGGPIRSTSG